MEHIVLLLLGIVISVIGIINMTGNISTVHSYNRRKVKEEDIPKYGKTIGAGTLVIGGSLIFAYIAALWEEGYMTYIVTPGIVIGLAIILYGQMKYNRGIF